MERILITGANRGIGLELARQYMQQGDARVFAAARRPDDAHELKRLAAAHAGHLFPLALDVTDQESLRLAAGTLSKHADALDVVINNAGIKPPAGAESFDGIKQETMLSVFQVNTVGPLLVAKAFLDLLKRGDNPRLVNISSQMGSMQWAGGGYYAYCTSKAALNMVTRRLARDLQPHGITTVTMHPGWVRTDMGGSSASLAPAESARGIRQVVASLTPQDNGQFLKWNGEVHPW